MYDSARKIFDYLAAIDALAATACDAVIGFGVFDLKLPRFCGEHGVQKQKTIQSLVRSSAEKDSLPVATVVRWRP